MNNFRTVNGFKIMDDDIEELFSIIMKSYADNENEINHVEFDMTELPQNLQYNCGMYLKVLKLCDILTMKPVYRGTKVLVQISNSAKNYFARKKEALNRAFLCTAKA